MNLPRQVSCSDNRGRWQEVWRALTISEPATVENFKEHLSGGEYILGVIMLKKTTHA